MKRQFLTAALLLAAAAPTLAPVTVRASQEHSEAPAGGQAPLSRVLKELAQRYPGKQLNTTMGQSGGRPVYLIQWQLSNGRIVVITVDAQTGQVISQ
jgi:uncharacterized membrane protein YkoI